VDQFYDLRWFNGRRQVLIRGYNSDHQRRTIWVDMATVERLVAVSPLILPKWQAFLHWYFHCRVGYPPREFQQYRLPPLEEGKPNYFSGNFSFIERVANNSKFRCVSVFGEQLTRFINSKVFDWRIGFEDSIFADLRDRKCIEVAVYREFYKELICLLHVSPISLAMRFVGQTGKLIEENEDINNTLIHVDYHLNYYGYTREGHEEDVFFPYHGPSKTRLLICSQPLRDVMGFKTVMVLGNSVGEFS
jgi:hypothetical protein